MCNIAGYTGYRSAASVLVDMLRREQHYDGGLSTGIATLHEGKIYMAKVTGDLDNLLAKTDALQFPGTIGIAHSRPGDGGQSHAHPFLDRDGHTALVLNGTLRDVDTEAFYETSRREMQQFLDAGCPIRSAVPSYSDFKRLTNGLSYHDTEFYALKVGELCETGYDVFSALAQTLDTLPGDLVTVALRDDVPDTLAVGRITRPMEIGIGEKESFLATTAMAFPEDVRFRAILSAPECAVTAVRPGSVEVTDRKLLHCRTEQITPQIYAKAWERMEALFRSTGKPLTLYDMPFYEEWRDLWQEPYVDCVYKKDTGLLKPYGALQYQILYDMRSRGLIREVMSQSGPDWAQNGLRLTGFEWVGG